MKEKFNEKVFIILLTVISGLILLSLCFSQGVWGDEMFTFMTVNHSYPELIVYIAGDVHPPLYYYIIKTAFVIFGDNIIVAKIITASATFGMITLGVTKIKKNWGTRTAVLFILSCVCMPQMLRYTVQLRMYSWAMFFVTLALLEFYDIVYGKNSKFTWIVMTLSGLAAAYTHYYALIAIAIIYAVMFCYVMIVKRDMIWKYLFVLFASVLGYLPWLAVFLRQLSTVKSDYWIEPIMAKKVVEMFGFPFLSSSQSFTAILICIYIIGLVCFVTEYKNKESIFEMTGFFLYICVFLSGILLSILIRPIFVVRYLLPCMPALYLCLSIVIRRANKYIYLFAVIAVICVGAVSYFEVFTEEYPSGMHETQTFLNDNIDTDDVILSEAGINEAAIMYYYPNETVDNYLNADVYMNRSTNVEVWVFATSDIMVEGLMKKGYNMDLCYENGTLDCMTFDIYKILED